MITKQRVSSLPEIKHIGGNNENQEIDALRWEIIRNDSVDVIERARLLERLIGRCGEVEIAEENRRFLDECTDELLRISAENLSTASTELGL